MSTQASTKPIALAAPDELPSGSSLARRSLRRFLQHRMAVLGGSILLGIILFVTVGAVIYSEEDANFNDTSRRLQAPSAATF